MHQTKEREYAPQAAGPRQAIWNTGPSVFPLNPRKRWGTRAYRLIAGRRYYAIRDSAQYARPGNIVTDHDRIGIIIDICCSRDSTPLHLPTWWAHSEWLAIDDPRRDKIVAQIVGRDADSARRMLSD